MGALHAGHASLIRAAAKSCGRVAVSIFVNPTQFGPNEDYSRYPRTFDADCALAQAEGADAIFAPTAEELYPAGASTFVEVAGLSNRLDCRRAGSGLLRPERRRPGRRYAAHGC
jgi:pantoate--beta-alanine ligase